MSKPNPAVEVYLSIRRQLSCFVAKIVPSKDVDDVLQDTFIRLCQVSDSTNIRHPQAFVYKTAKNLALDMLKSANSRQTAGHETGDEIAIAHKHGVDDATYQAVVTHEELGFFCEAVQQLPRNCRRVYVLKKVYGFTQREIAQKLGLSENTVEKHIGIGIMRCREYMSLRQRSTGTEVLKVVTGHSHGQRDER